MFFLEYRHLSIVSLFVDVDSKIPGKMLLIPLSHVSWKWEDGLADEKTKLWQASDFTFYFCHACCFTLSSSMMSVTFQSDENLNFSY